jgi:DNA-directed RNA polymerase specialized sigma24 family protein
MADASRRHVRGDEAELFERYHARLIRATAFEVRTSRENVEEACGFAWAQLMSHDVRRATVYSWLKEVARREALRLDRIYRQRVHLAYEPESVDSEIVAAPVEDPAVMRERWEVALDRLRSLAERDRRAVAMRALGWRYVDIGRELGISYTRVNQILTLADKQLSEIEERSQPPRTERVARLRALEAEPPRYLRDAIGRAPAISRRKGWEEVRREWRRLALAIEDFRADFGITDPRRALGGAGKTRAHRVRRYELQERIASFSLELGRYRS